jgi:long-chain fatty acid transport protein
MKSKTGMNADQHSPEMRQRVAAIVYGVSLVMCLMLCFSTGARADGYRLPNQDPEAIARGNAFAATADNPAAIYYNPAGITQIQGQQASAGIYLISTSEKFTSTSGATASVNTDFQPVPQIYYVFSPNDFPLSFGLGIYAPYGLAIDWGENPPFQNVAEKGSLDYVTANPVVAWKILPQLSVAGGLTVNYAKASFTRGIGFTPNDQFYFSGDDTECGFNGGIFWQPIKMLAFGVNYRYSTTMQLGGHSTAYPYASAQPTSASIRFPQNASVGMSFRPTEDWNFEFDADWTDWDSVNQIDFQGTALGQPLPSLPQNYESSWMYEFGVTRQLGKGYYASAGYIYSENSIPNQYFNPLIPDCNLSLASVGLGYNGARWTWAASYTLAFAQDRPVTGSVYDTGVPGGLVNGTYRELNNAVNFSIGIKF